jgi:hypothetical protein
MRESLEQEQLALPVCLHAATYDPYEAIAMDYVNPFSLLRRNDKDTMYMDQALKAPDRAKFIKAMQKEVASHTDRGHWKLILKSEVPKGHDIIPTVWSMKRKRRIKTREVYKWKARLNVHGGKQTHGVNYWDTYAPVVTWPTIRLILVLSLLFNWYTAQVDYVLAYPQADAECDLYLSIPRGFHSNETGSSALHVLKLIKNIYGQKQAGKVWNDYMNDKLTTKLGYTRSKIDPCLYYHGTALFVIFVDDGIFASPDAKEIDKLKIEMGQVFEMTDEGDLNDYLGVNIDRRSDGTIELTQPHLINQIIEDVNFVPETKTKKHTSTIIQNAPTRTRLRRSQGNMALPKFDRQAQLPIAIYKA